MWLEEATIAAAWMVVFVSGTCMSEVQERRLSVQLATKTARIHGARCMMNTVWSVKNEEKEESSVVTRSSQNKARCDTTQVRSNKFARHVSEHPWRVRF